MGKMVPATEFKAKCLGLLDEMERTGEALTISRRGKPALTLTAQKAVKPGVSDIFGCMKGMASYHDDLDVPIDADWEKKWLAKWDKRLRDDPA